MREIQGNELTVTEDTAESVLEPGFVEIGSVRHSPKIGNIASALAAAQLEFLPIYKENENPAFRSRYADLVTIIAATQKACAKQGLVVIQSPTTHGRDLTLTTMLIHSSGEWLASDLTMPATMRDGFTAQTIGSAVTYSRRYALQALLGVSADVDDDANAASGVGTHEQAQAVGKKKVEDLTGKLKQSIEEAKAKKANGGYVTSLFYQWNDSSQTAEISGDEGLKTANKDLLKPLWSTVAKAIIANADQLDALKFQLEQRAVPFTQLGGKG